MADKNQEIVEGQKYIPYPSASEACSSLNSSVPIGFAREQVFFNNDLKAVLFDVDEFVRTKLQYDSTEELCNAFNREQIDAIATAIYNWETNGNAMIVSDQTGMGKGRIVSGLIRYSIFTLKKTPIFFTEADNLFSDIYRDLYDVGVDAGIPIETAPKKKEVEDVSILTDEFIQNIIERDIDNDTFRVDYKLPDDEPIEKIFNDENEDKLDEVIELYRLYIVENGLEESEKNIKTSDKDLQEAIEQSVKEKRIRVFPYAPFKLEIKDNQGNIIYRVSDNEAKKGISSGVISDRYRLICLKYSTLQKNIYNAQGQLTPKGILVNKLASDNVIIMDESHNAAGQSLRSQVMIGMLRSAKYVTYVSATWVKRPDNLPIYAVRTSIRDTYLSFSQIVTAFTSGGLPLQEVVSSKLVSSGQLIRREKPLEGEVNYYEENQHSVIGQRQIEKLNTITLSWEELRNNSERIKSAFKRAVKGAFPDKTQSKIRLQFKYKGDVKRQTFLLFNYFILGLKVNQCIEEALTQLRDGKKVVIAIGNTLESAFSNIQQNYIDQIGYKVGDRIKNDFNLVLEYLLYSSSRIAFKEETGVTSSGRPSTITTETNLVHREWDKPLRGKEADGVSVIDILNDVQELASQQYASVLRRLQSLSMPLSPIDVIKAMITNAGFSVDEITGRQRELVFTENENNTINTEYGILSDRTKLSKKELVNRFNSNQLDCLIINRSGSTGLSLHAIQTIAQGKIVAPVNVPAKGETKPIPTSLEPRNEVKQRCMLILQMELNVATEIQKLGRINRNGQIYPPLYKYIISAIPSEARLSAMMQKKLKSLMASTTGEQDFGKDVFDVDDLFSDVAVKPWNDTCDKLRLGSEYNVANGADIENKTKMFYFESYSLQVDFFRQLSERLQEHIATLTAKGQYFAKLQYKDYRAKTKAVIPFILGNNNATSEFGNHTFAELSECFVIDPKNTEAIVFDDIKSNLKIKNYDTGEIERRQTIPSFQQLARDQADKYADWYIESRVEQIKNFEQYIVESKDELQQLLIEAKMFPKIEDIVDLETKINELKQEQEKLTQDVVAKLQRGEIDTTSAPMIGQITEEIKVLTEKLTNLLGSSSDSESIRRESERINKSISKANDRIVNYELRIKNIQGDIDREKQNKGRFLTYINNIGKVCRYINYQEVKLETENSTIEYAYNVNIDEQSVLVGVSYDDQTGHFTNASITLHLVTIDKYYYVKMNVLHPDLYEDELLQKKKPIEEIQFTNQDFENYWDEYIRQRDTGYYKDKVFLSGNILKGLAYNNQLSLFGTLTKYSKEDGKQDIGLELGVLSAESIMFKFNEGTDFSFLFGLSIENILNLCPQMLATAIYNGRKDVVMQLVYEFHNIALVMTLEDETYSSFFQQSLISSDEDEFVSTITRYIRDIFETKVIFTLVSGSCQPIHFFDNLCNGLGSESETFPSLVFNDYGNPKHCLHQLIDHNQQNVQNGCMIGDTLTAWSSPITYTDTPAIFSFYYDGLANNKADYLFSGTLYESRKNTKIGEKYFLPTYNLSMSYMTLSEIISYLQAEYIQLVGVTSNNALKKANIPYVFEVASLTRGTLDKNGEVQIQGVGDGKYQPIEDVLTEFLEYYKTI